MIVESSITNKICDRYTWMRNRFRAQCWQKINRNQSEAPPLNPPPPSRNRTKNKKIDSAFGFYCCCNFSDNILSAREM